MEPSDLLRHLVNVFESLGIRYFVTGSVASIFYGEPRFTNDIDVVADIENWVNRSGLHDIWKAILEKL